MTNTRGRDTREGKWEGRKGERWGRGEEGERGGRGKEEEIVVFEKKI